MSNSACSAGETRFFFGSRQCAAVIFSQEPKKCVNLDFSLPYILTSGTYSKFSWETKISSTRRLLPAALLERWPQVCSFKFTFTLLQTNCFVTATRSSMKCHVSWIPLRIRVRSRHTQPHFKTTIGHIRVILCPHDPNVLVCVSDFRGGVLFLMTHFFLRWG